MKVAICAGGTGGHMFPACALFYAMKEKNHDATLVTDKRGDVFCGGISKKIVLDTVRISMRKLPSVLVHLAKDFAKFWKTWRNDTPDVVVGFGGLFTVIPLLTAKIFGAKVVICEQNTVIGKANRLLEPFADLKLSAFDIGGFWKKVSMPVRKEFLQFSHTYNCGGGIKILIIGGSQGARSFSRIIPEALARLDRDVRKNIEIVQQISFDNISDMQDMYSNLGVKAKLLKFVDNVAELMSDAQLVICRAGASTLSELAEMGRPAVLIPYPEASENHQYKNAVYYAEKDAAWVVEENSCAAEKLSDILDNVVRDRSILRRVAENIRKTKAACASDSLIELIEQTRGSKK